MTVKAILAELRSWRSRPSRWERFQARPRDQEHPDPTPVALPVGYKTPPTMDELIQLYVREAVSQKASDQGFGTFEEEDDFSEDDPNPLPMGEFEVNEYEMEDDPDMPEAPGVDDPTPPGGTPPSGAPAAEAIIPPNEGEKPSDQPP